MVKELNCNGREKDLPGVGESLLTEGLPIDSN